jgi:RHS repeat-associated protein
VNVALDANNVPTNRIAAQGVMYDNNGNQTQGFGLAMTYDVANRLSAVGNGTFSYYAYDSDNRRIYSRNASGSETIYFYGADGMRIATYTYTMITYNGNAEIQLTQQSQNVYFLGKPISAEGNLVSTDRLGSVRSGGPGGLGYQAQYPYGVEYSLTANDREKYATYTRDSATGFDYATNRYYASQWGRFLSPDPSGASMSPGNPQSWNRYVYVSGDPVNHADPTGLFITVEGCIVNPEACQAEDWFQPIDSLWGAGPDGLPCGFGYGTVCTVEPDEGCVDVGPGSGFLPMPPMPTPVPCPPPAPAPPPDFAIVVDATYDCYKLHMASVKGKSVWERDITYSAFLEGPNDTLTPLSAGYGSSVISEHLTQLPGQKGTPGPASSSAPGQPFLDTLSAGTTGPFQVTQTFTVTYQGTAYNASIQSSQQKIYSANTINVQRTYVSINGDTNLGSNGSHGCR